MNIAVGLNTIADWSAAQPFLSVLKGGRAWQARSATAWTSHDNDQLRSGGHLDADGNPIRILPEANRVGTIILCEISPRTSA